jgi:hypothetical protein
LSAQARSRAISKKPFSWDRVFDRSGIDVGRLKDGDRLNEGRPTTAATRALLQVSEFLYGEDQIFSFGHITQSLRSEMVAHGGRHAITQKRECKSGKLLRPISFRTDSSGLPLFIRPGSGSLFLSVPILKHLRDAERSRKTRQSLEMQPRRNLRLPPTRRNPDPLEFARASTSTKRTIVAHYVEISVVVKIRAVSIQSDAHYKHFGKLTAMRVIRAAAMQELGGRIENSSLLPHSSPRIQLELLSLRPRRRWLALT